MSNHRRSVFKAALLTTCLLTPAASWAQSTDSAQATEVDAIVVTGRRAADRAALENKRRADNQVDAIRADDVGRLPDQNVAAALRRLTGQRKTIAHIDPARLAGGRRRLAYAGQIKHLQSAQTRRRHQTVMSRVHSDQNDDSAMGFALLDGRDVDRSRHDRRRRSLG